MICMHLPCSQASWLQLTLLPPPTISINFPVNSGALLYALRPEEVSCGVRDNRHLCLFNSSDNLTNRELAHKPGAVCDVPLFPKKSRSRPRLFCWQLLHP